MARFTAKLNDRFASRVMPLALTASVSR